MRPRFDYGDEVRVVRNVRNDGTYPGKDTGNLLVRRGSTGYVRDVGTFLQDQIIYSVHFLHEDRVVGCREEELLAADEPWTPSRFEFRDQVAARLTLAVGGRVLVEQGEIGEIVKVLRGAATPQGAGDVAYHVHFPGRNTLQVPESALEAVIEQTLVDADGTLSAAPPAASSNAPLPGETSSNATIAPGTTTQEDAL
jgi:nitrogen fixation protein NifZ